MPLTDTANGQNGPLEWDRYTHETLLTSNVQPGWLVLMPDAPPVHRRCALHPLSPRQPPFRAAINARGAALPRAATPAVALVGITGLAGVVLQPTESAPTWPKVLHRLWLMKATEEREKSIRAGCSQPVARRSR